LCDKKTNGPSAQPYSPIMRKLRRLLDSMYGPIWLENPYSFKIGLAHPKIFVIGQKPYTNWLGFREEKKLFHR